MDAIYFLDSFPLQFQQELLSDSRGGALWGESSPI